MTTEERGARDAIQQVNVLVGRVQSQFVQGSSAEAANVLEAGLKNLAKRHETTPEMLMTFYVCQVRIAAW